MNYKEEIETLTFWFNYYYTQHEQKYRRLIALEKLCDDNSSPNERLRELYLDAEVKRKRLQELKELDK